MEQAEYRRNLDLYGAAITGDWESASRIFENDETALTATLTRYNEIPLLIAAGTGRATNFVTNLVQLMKVKVPEALGKTDNFSMSALHLAARYCNTETVFILAKECPNLVYATSYLGPRTKNWLPVHWSAESADKVSLLHLLNIMYNDNSIVPAPLADLPGAELLIRLINSEFYDEALGLLHRYPQLANLQNGYQECGLGQIAKKSSAFPSGSSPKYYSLKHFIYSCVPVHAELKKYAQEYIRLGIEIPTTPRNVYQQWAQALWEKLSSFVPLVKDTQQKKLGHEQALLLVKLLCTEMRSADDIKATESLAKAAVLEATKSGIHEVVEEIVSSFPSVIWQYDSYGRYIFHMAVAYRHENVFNLMYNMSEHKYVMLQSQDYDGNTMLHLAGKIAPLNKLKLVPGAALQMQRELQWFEEVKKFVPPTYRVLPNKEELTPWEVFIKEHAQLATDGEKWMKDTTNSLTIVAALIVTVVFAAAITVPGGNNGSTGFPLFPNDAGFIIFAVSDAIALFTSTTSLLMFVSILTSRYAESDFLYTLPNRLIIGLLTLFLSITTMTIAFSAALYMVLGRKKAATLIPVVALTCLPIASFVKLQFPLLVELISSTYSSSFGKKSDRPFY